MPQISLLVCPHLKIAFNEKYPWKPDRWRYQKHSHCLCNSCSVHQIQSVLPANSLANGSQWATAISFWWPRCNGPLTTQNSTAGRYSMNAKVALKPCWNCYTASAYTSTFHNLKIGGQGCGSFAKQRPCMWNILVQPGHVPLKDLIRRWGGGTVSAQETGELLPSRGENAVLVGRMVWLCRRQLHVFTAFQARYLIVKFQGMFVPLPC